MHRILRYSVLGAGILAALSCAPDTRSVTQPSTVSRFVNRANAMPEVRISEIHYDDAGTDIDERIEVSAPAGTDMSAYSLVLYNGSGGASYDTDVLSGIVPNSCDGRGVVVLAYAVNGIQNGDPDGVALVGPAGVIEFLSYEGAFTATNGPAAGMTSTDIGVREAGTEVEGQSLQRNGNGDNTWNAPAAHTFGACNDIPAPTTPVASLTIAPTTSTIAAGATQTFTATALSAEGNPIPGAPLSWASSDPAIAQVSSTGVATGLSAGEVTITVSADGGASANATLTVTEPPPLPPTDVFISEIHYDNGGVDENEAIEVEGPAGTDFTGWSLVLYNGNGGASYATIPLTGTGTSCGAGRTVTFVPAVGIQNGAPDGVALVNAGGALVEFISYEGAFRASNGPAAGRLSVDIGIDETGSGALNTSLQKDSLGWFGPSVSSFGACNVAPPPFVSIFGRTNADPPLPVGYEDQMFAEFNDGRGGTAPSTFVWMSETPDLASVDADGVVHAKGAGVAVIRATAPDGATGTFSLNTIVATASPTAAYAGNTEFGTPKDKSPADDFIIKRAQYTSSFNKDRGIPNWVSFNLEATHFGDQDRCDCFTFDPLLPSSFTRYTTADYTGAGAAAGYGIDRGHLARSFDRTSGNLDNATTFLFSNIIPQASDNNQGPWSAMEIAIGDLARFQDKELFIIAGASGSKGTVKNEGLITIPSHVWKVVVVMPRDQGRANIDTYRDFEVIAVIMPNDPGIRNVPWETYKTTVNAVEALSGYNVLTLLSAKNEGVIETGMKDVIVIVDQLVAAGRLSATNGEMLNGMLEASSGLVEKGKLRLKQNLLGSSLSFIDKLESEGLLDADGAAELRTALARFFALNGVS